LRNVPVIGDSLRDLQAALAVEAQPLLVLTGKGLITQHKLTAADDIPVFNNLAEAVDALLAVDNAL
jgi:D-glycero-D-manno-heptose 1,7-bisphosphate phosphatase